MVKMSPNTRVLTSGRLARLILDVKTALTVLKPIVEAMQAAERHNLSSVQSATNNVAERLESLLAAVRLDDRANRALSDAASQALEDFRVTTRESGAKLLSMSQAYSRLNEAAFCVISQFPTTTELLTNAMGAGKVLTPLKRTSKKRGSGHQAILLPRNPRKPRQKKQATIPPKNPRYH